MCLGGRMACAQRAPLSRFSSTHGAAHGQYVSQRELGLHINIIIIQHRRSKRWSILLSGVQLHPKTGSYLELESERVNVWSKLNIPIPDGSPHSWRERRVLLPNC